MIIYPAIDLRQGRCVRLRQGDPDAETVFGEDPAATARHWAAQGAEWLHVVNLDGALGATQAHIGLLHRPASIRVQRPGQAAPTSPLEELAARLPVNLRRLHEIRQAVPGLPIQFGGGLRTLDDIQLALELGADRVVLGTAALDRPALVGDALARWGADRIVVGLDARDGLIATHGWQQTSGVDVIDMGHRMAALGVTRVVYTDISRDGMLNGVNVEATARLGDLTGLRVIASGGVAGIEDVERLKEREHYNIEGVIVGQALYVDRLDLRAAVELGHRPLSRHSAGVVPVRPTPAGPEFLLLYNCFFDQWQFPRGGVRAGEDDLAAARRALADKTALPLAELHSDCRTVLQYTANIHQCDIARTIVYFLAEVADGDLALGHADHCEARWASADEAWALLTETSPEQLPAFDAALEYLQARGWTK